jgi:hypothetical protein
MVDLRSRDCECARPAVGAIADQHFKRIGDRNNARPQRNGLAFEAKLKHVIVRREYYIECSCGYKGPALDGACRDCGTGELSWELRVHDIESG